MSIKPTPIIFQVPTAMKFVLRNAWFSNSDNPGHPGWYTTWDEGYSFWLPVVWHQVVALVDLRPHAHDPRDYRVNTIDGQHVDVNVRFVDRVINEPKIRRRNPDTGEEVEVLDDEAEDKKENVLGNPIYLNAIKVESEGGIDRDQIVGQVLTKALNIATADYPSITCSPEDLRSTEEKSLTLDEWHQKIIKRIPRLEKVPPRYWEWMYYLSKIDLEGTGEIPKEARKKGLAELNETELNILSIKIRNIANQELAEYGLQFDEVSVQRITLAGPLLKALKRRAAASVEMDTAGQEKRAVEIMMEALSPSNRNAAAEVAVLLVNRMLDTVRDVAGYRQDKAPVNGHQDED